MQAAILAEARGTNQATMQAVADVVVNRSKEQGKSVCAVMKQRGQFALPQYKKQLALISREQLALLNSKHKTNRKKQSSEQQKDLDLSATIASSTLQKGSKQKNILFFHVKQKKYSWTRKLKLVKQDKYHRYYALNED